MSVRSLVQGIVYRFLSWAVSLGDDKALRERLKEMTGRWHSGMD